MTQIEPDTVGDTDHEHMVSSIAISLKRIADALQGLSGPLNAYGETIGECIQGQHERGLRGIPQPMTQTDDARDAARQWAGERWPNQYDHAEREAAEEAFAVGFEAHLRSTSPMRLLLAEAGARLKVEAVHMEYDCPGDVPEDCGLWCRICADHVDDDHNNHAPSCLIARINDFLAKGGAA